MALWRAQLDSNKPNKANSNTNTNSNTTKFQDLEENELFESLM